jgi:hypothetical protein
MNFLPKCVEFWQIVRFLARPETAESTMNLPTCWCPYLPLVAFTASALTTLSIGECAELESLPLAPRKASATKTLFNRVPEQASGISFTNPIDTSHALKRLYIAGFACGGIALGDVTGDGKVDVYLTGGAATSNRLYIQTEPWEFEDVTSRAGIGATDRWCSGAAMADIDGDGDLDMYVCSYDAPNLLFLNQTKKGGPVVFEEAAVRFGVDVVDASLMANFCDYDRDGDLDLFVQCSEYKRENGRPAELPVIEENGKYRLKPAFEKYYTIKKNESGKETFINAGRENYLFRNEGNGKSFTNVTKTAGIGTRNISNSSTWWDYNEDGWMDLYVGNDFRDADQLYRNNKDGTFTDVIKDTLLHTTWFSMGADAGDVNNDGLTDFLIADMAGTSHYVSKATMGEMGKFKTFLTTAVPRQLMRNALYVNTGTPRFMEASFMSGMASTDWTWAVKLADFDNDGLVDAFFSNGVARSFNDSDNARSVEEHVGQTAWDHWEKFPPRKEQNLAYKNLGDLAFEDVSKSWGLDHVGMSYASATGDLDGDGDLDLVVASLDESVEFYRNDSTAGNAISVRLNGAKGNTGGIGAKVIVVAGENRLTRHSDPFRGFLSSNAPDLHFGVGDASKVTLQVEWPSGHIQGFRDLQVGHLHVITEPKAKATKREKRLPPAPFVRSTALAKVTHRDVYHDDYATQPLLPWRHSSLGPGMAWGDIDGDGDEDFYLSAPKGQAGVLQINDGSGIFSVRNSPAIAAHAEREDLAPLFFDADGDGDLDLYVVSGSVESKPGASSLSDRLYLNNRKGSFFHHPKALPKASNSGSCAVAADYDRDGDLDLFVGGRVIPGQWPETPVSSLLRNDTANSNVKFTEVAPDPLKSAGLVTSALWSDTDNDGWIDLLVTCEWGPVRFYHNDSGALKEATSAAGLGAHLGWWNGIAGGDLDHDGDIDYVATNFGLNTQYKATPKKPELLYYGDLDGSGRKHIVEAKFEGSVCYPRRGLSCSSHAMPGVRKKLPTFQQFALADLAAIYTKTRIEKAEKFEVTHLASSVLLNDGQGKFKVIPLPRYAQASPAFGVVLTDFDADGHLDCLVAQNFFSPQHETGNMDGGLSALLHGKGDGTFDPVWPAVGGIVVPGDTKGLTVLDINADGTSDFVFGLNANPAWTFLSRIREKPLTVRLSSTFGANRNGIGARLTFTPKASPKQTMELYAGGGYLSQSPAAAKFGASGNGGELTVRWPEGKISTHAIPSGQTAVTINQPEP